MHVYTQFPVTVSKQDITKFPKELDSQAVLHTLLVTAALIVVRFGHTSQYVSQCFGKL